MRSDWWSFYNARRRCRRRKDRTSSNCWCNKRRSFQKNVREYFQPVDLDPLLTYVLDAPSRWITQNRSPQQKRSSSQDVTAALHQKHPKRGAQKHGDEAASKAAAKSKLQAAPEANFLPSGAAAVAEALDKQHKIVLARELSTGQAFEQRAEDHLPFVVGVIIFGRAWQSLFEKWWGGNLCDPFLRHRASLPLLVQLQRCQEGNELLLFVGTRLLLGKGLFLPWRLLAFLLFFLLFLLAVQLLATLLHLQLYLCRVGAAGQCFGFSRCEGMANFVVFHGGPDVSACFLGAGKGTSLA